MNRVTIEDQEGALRIQVDYTVEKVIKILIAIFLLIPVVVVVPVCAGQIILFPEEAPGNLVVISIIMVCTLGGLIALWFWSNHQQMMSVTRQDGILEIVRAFAFLRFPRWYRLADIFDIMKDAKRTEKPGDKYFLQIQSVAGERVKITRPSARITKNNVDNIYDALRPHIALPPPARRLAFYRHITVTDSSSDTTITFRTRLHFISVRYFGILITLLAFLGFTMVLTIYYPPFLLYPGSAMIGLFLLLFLPFLLPMRKKYLAHNRNVATLQIHKDRPTIAIQSSVEGARHDYPSILLKSIKHVPLSTGSELTFARHGTTEYTSYYTITLNVGTQEEIFLYTTENDAEAMYVKEFLENLVKSAQK